MTNYLRKMLTDAELEGFEFQCLCEGDEDYRGFHSAAAEEALTACDEMTLVLRMHSRPVGLAIIINGLAPDEVISDCSGWVEEWTKRNIAYE